MEIEALQTGPLGVNTYILPLARKIVLLVDPAASPCTNDQDVIKSFLFERDLVPIGILLTHGHFDHVAGLKTLHRSFPDIPIAIHKEDASFIGKASARMQAPLLLNLGMDEEPEILQELSDLPEATFFLEDREHLDKYFSAADIIQAFKGESDPDIEPVLNELSHWTVIHTPGHTRGSVCFYNETQKALVSADTIFYQSYGRTDLPGGNEEEMQKSLDLIFTKIPKDTLVYPGHGTFGFELSENL